jgi:glycerol-3-phosphate dehydrogenase subunit C
MDKNISYAPTDGLSYEPTEEKYWNKEGLNKEIERTFEICHGCRMCFKYCDSFPSLFKFIDDRHDGDVRKITDTETEQIMDECFQCKLCEVQCPYTERDNHEFKLDFPKLVHRYKAIRHKEKGASLRDKMLGDPDKAGKMARALPVILANTANRNKIHRYFFETPSRFCRRNF